MDTKNSKNVDNTGGIINKVLVHPVNIEKKENVILWQEIYRA